MDDYVYACILKYSVHYNRPYMTFLPHPVYLDYPVGARRRYLQRHTVVVTNLVTGFSRTKC